jgi:Tfp pilus assembly protein PilF
VKNENLNNAIVMEKQGRLAEAEKSYRLAIDQQPSSVEARFLFGLFLHRLCRLWEAEAVFRQAIGFGPGYASLRNNLACVLRELGRHDEALQELHNAIVLDPHNCDAYLNAAVILTRMALFEEAERFLRKILTWQPGHSTAQLYLGQLLLRKGHYPEGWLLYEARLKEGGVISSPDLPFPRWNGESLAGKSLLVCPEQGLGDCIQFSRYLPLLKVRGLARLSVAVDASTAALHRLFAQIEGVDGLVTLSTAAGTVPCHDYWCSIMSLPFHFGTTIETIPDELPYLQAGEEKVAAWRHLLPGKRMRVGIVWSGNPRIQSRASDEVDARRSINILRLLELLRTPNIAFVSLQKGEAAQRQLAELPDNVRPLDPMDKVRDMSDTAAIIENLDLVITVDTSIAHLAGALGKPVWVLSRFAGCWRWFDDRDDSPWYPGVLRLFRQPSPWDWATPIERVREELARFSAGA